MLNSNQTSLTGMLHDGLQPDSRAEGSFMGEYARKITLFTDAQSIYLLIWQVQHDC